MATDSERGRLVGKVALTFGGGRGIGRGACLAMAEEGAAVVVADINAEGAASVADEIAQRGGGAIGAHCDVTDAAQVGAAISAAVRSFDRVDAVINLAYAGTTRGPLEALTADRLRRELEVSVVGMFTTMTLALPELKKTRGSVVNFSSGAALEGTPGLAGYAAAKQAVRGLTHAAAREWGPYGVRANSIVPLGMGPAVERFYAGDPDAFARSVSTIPLGRYGDPERDIGPAIAFLVSDDARYITGQTILLDGGQSHL
jgi:NAD(P)-dependent dehydrogenase (short-subunit alcohol dehydrogenase family)